MKTLADMTIDEAIAYTLGKVPECFPLGMSRNDQGLPWLFDHFPDWSPRGPREPDKYLVMANVWDEGADLATFAEGPLLHALFFRAAWVWLKSKPGHTWDICPMHGGWGVFDARSPSHSGLYETEIHALCAAVLLTSNHPVP